MTTDDQPRGVDLPPPPALADDGTYSADVVIVGAGIAGLMAAIHLDEGLDVLVIDKGSPVRSGSSPWAQGGLAAALDPTDSPALHALDTHRASDGLCDNAAVQVLAHEAPERVADLIALGAVLDGHDGPAVDVTELHLAREGAQAVARSVHRADATGAELVRALRVPARGRVQRLPAMVVELATDDHGRVVGAWVLDADHSLRLVRCRALLLAAGGCGGLFAATTNQDRATADGVVLAYRGGAAVRDLEFVQFHPTGLAISGAWRFLLTEALRGAGATLHDDDGNRFMLDVHPDAELAPRHVVASAILALPSGQAWLDATHLTDEQFAEEFPTVLAGAAAYGFDLANSRVPVTPAAHYMVGGVRTDLHGRTSVAGLWAAGEVASTGLHGANRMAGNSLSEALVFGRRAALSMSADLRGAVDAIHGAPRRPELTSGGDAAFMPTLDLDAIRDRLRTSMWQGSGPVRDDQLLATTLTELRAIRAELGERRTNRDHAELWLAVRAAELIATSARLRRESRGGHHRRDLPDTDPLWADVHLERIHP